MYMGIPMTTSSQAWTAPALHSDMHVFRVSSACWRRSSCSSPSDRLCCVRLSESGLVRRSYGVAYRRGSGSEGYGNQKNDQSGDRSTSELEGICIKNTPPHQCVRIDSNKLDATLKYQNLFCVSATEICLSDFFLCLLISIKSTLSVNWMKSSFNPFVGPILT